MNTTINYLNIVQCLDYKEYLPRNEKSVKISFCPPSNLDLN